MTKYKLLLDESGCFDNIDERYIIIGGLLFNEDNQDKLEEILTPIYKHLLYVYDCDELHGCKNKELKKIINPIIGSYDELMPIVMVIDKKDSFIFDLYDKKSFKYNKAIEHLIKKMINDGVLQSDDEIYIKIDNINLNDNEKKNLKEWLPSRLSIVKKVEEADSKNIICLQFADIIVNSFSRNRKCKLNLVEHKSLNPKLYFFLNSTASEYVKEYK